MPQTFDEETNRSIWSKGDWTTNYCREGLEQSQGTLGRRIRIVRVRDYKEKFILKTLQEEARKKNPGFKWFDECSQDAMVAWSNHDGIFEPAGYILVTKEFYDRGKGKDQSRWYPVTLNQLFVRRGFRRNGIGSGLLSQHISSRGNGQIWVESPKWETRSMLEKLGYEETNERYEVWQMHEGLTLWKRGCQVLKR